MEIEMTIKAILTVPATRATVVLLKEETGDRELPIWVGPCEARAIGMQIENLETPRPLTHDLMRELLRELDTRVQRVVIHSITDRTFLAHIHLERKRLRMAIDARPSDAIALALRTRAPIFVTSQVMDAAPQLGDMAPDGPGEPPQDKDELDAWLETLDEEDLGGAQ